MIDVKELYSNAVSHAKSAWQRTVSTLDKISTRPNKTSWRWRGKVSILAFVVLHIIYISRIFSLLQIAKYIYRNPLKMTRGGDKNTTLTTDARSKRPNIPPVFVEVYFMLWGLFLFLMPSLVTWMGGSGETLFFRCASGYFLAESLFFLLYYFFFRRFFEEHYAIMHALEYIVLLPLIIMVQARAISLMFHYTLSTSLSLLFFPTNNCSLFIIVLSVLYTALVFGIFISNLPIEQVKQKDQFHYDFSIVGNGAIVQNRLKYALAESKIAKDVIVVDKLRHTYCEEVLGNARIKYATISEASLKEIVNSNILWIATPPFAHIEYLSKYVNQLFIAIEKPVVTNESELAVVVGLREAGLWNRVFCLSYYYLEKALPLTYLFRPFTFYEEYLDLHEAQRKQVLSTFNTLGALRRVEFVLFEGEDNRSWVEEKQYGGHFYETFLHLVVMARLAVKEDTEWIEGKWHVEHRGGHYMSEIEYTGRTRRRGTKIHLHMGKFMPAERIHREGVLEYEGGMVKIDLQRQELTLCPRGTKRPFVIGTKAEYTQTKYRIQVEMVERCAEKNLLPSLVDGSDIQLDALKWLMQQRRA